MDADPESEERIGASAEEELLYRRRLGESWNRRFGQRRDGTSRLSAYGSALVLAAGAPALACAALRPGLLPPATVVAVVAAMVVGIALFQGLNGHFRAAERAAFNELDGALEPAGASARKAAAARRSPFYPLAKLAVRPRVRFKAAWIEKRMADFLNRRAERDRQAEIFEKRRVKLGSIHGTTEHHPSSTR